jgi:hypothetical protein
MITFIFKKKTKQAEMTRDTANLPQYNQRPEWEQMPKTGVGSEYNRENKEMARRRKFGFMPRKTSIEDLPWILTAKATTTTDAAATAPPSNAPKTAQSASLTTAIGNKDRQYIGKKSVSENSSYFVFIKCADGGFEVGFIFLYFYPNKLLKSAVLCPFLTHDHGFYCDYWLKKV